MEAAVFNEKIWFAIAEPSRRKLLDLLVARGESTASKLAQEVTISRQAVSKHITVLKQAGLVCERRTHKDVLFDIELSGLNDAAKELSSAARLWNNRLQRIKLMAEELHNQEKANVLDRTKL